MSSKREAGEETKTKKTEGGGGGQGTLSMSMFQFYFKATSCKLMGMEISHHKIVS